MRLATIRDGGSTRAVRIDGDLAVDLGAADVAEVLRWRGWRDRCAAADGRRYGLDGLSLAPVVTAPEKIICVGLNYRPHIQEMGRELPTGGARELPACFAMDGLACFPLALPGFSPRS